jgi:hypothetical protein
MPDFNLLGSLVRDLHQEFVRIYYLMLPIFFALSVIVTWVRSPQGSLEFIDVLKRAVISTVLLVALPDISSAIIFVADGIAQRVDQLNGLDTFLRMAQEKSLNFTFVKNTILLQFPDLIIALLSFVSYLILYIARYLTIAMYHFFWIFYMISAPLLLLFNLFPSTSQIAGNLFKGMIEVASWKIVWAILGAMLTALSFGDAYKTEGNYLTLMVMNFVIAISMLMTPSIVKSLVAGGFHSLAGKIGSDAAMTMAAVPAKGAMVLSKGRAAMTATKGFVNSRVANYRSEKQSGGTFNATKGTK